MLQDRQWAVANAMPRNAIKDSFSVMSYNVLSDTLLNRHPHLYKNTDDKYLDWDYRSRLIIKEIMYLLPDVVCMQEVEPTAFKEDFQIDLEEEYTGVYCQRTGDAVDGCAMFYRSKKLRLIHNENIDFKEITQKDNIAIISVFELRPFKDQTTPAIQFSVATTHLLFNTNRGYLKLAQLHSLVTKMEDISKQFGGLNTIICGDFNMTEESVMYHYMTTGETEPFLFQESYISGQNAIRTEDGGTVPYGYTFDILRERKQYRTSERKQLTESLAPIDGRYQPVTKKLAGLDWNSKQLFKLLEGETGVLKHGFRFEDAVFGKGSVGSNRELKYFSSFHAASQTLVDFVFFSPPPVSSSEMSSTTSASTTSTTTTSNNIGVSLVALEFLEPPTVPVQKQRGARRNYSNIDHMPSKGTPSDHIPLVVEFGFV
ncbi:Endonuclease/exonuclease/phosphatase [Obelidium mucronatum]|nr:Endonuclease/exonuclease/phosphatase [Obelidium mucronatum]